MATPTGAVPIERLQVGDRVWGFEADTGLSTAATVTHQHSTHAMTYELVMGSRHVNVTANHPVYSLAHQDYIRADELQAGDELLARPYKGDPSPCSVSATLVPVGRRRVYNITVEPTHNYFAGDVLVHNKTPFQDVAMPDETARDTTRDFSSDGP